MSKRGQLYLVATPIGNLEDISLRALKVLQEVDLILAEDTKRAQILLGHYSVKKPLLSFYQHIQKRRLPLVLERLKQGEKIAFIAEAGTPAISDPGGLLVEEVVQSGLAEIIPIPGPNAAITALSVAGFLTDRFLFLGFLPKKKGRHKLISSLKNYQYTIVFYESPYRIVSTLAQLKEVLGDREVVVCRELTKRFETIYRGLISQVLPQLKPKGEFVVVIKGVK